MARMSCEADRNRHNRAWGRCERYHGSVFHGSLRIRDPPLPGASDCRYQKLSGHFIIGLDTAPKDTLPR